MSSSPFSLTPTQTTGKDALLCRTCPFDASWLDGTDFQVDKVSYVELMPNDEVYGLVVQHIICEAAEVRSFRLNVGRGKPGCCHNDDDDDDNIVRTTQKSLGLGVFTFEHLGKKIAALHQTLGEPVGTDCGATMMKTLVLCANDIDDIIALSDELIQKADKTDSRKFTLYRWHVDYQYWRREETAPARLLESVVLPKATRSKLVADMDDFVSPGTRAWYQNHGIPYKRSYLLFGSPGAGKTSVIQALAGRYKRSLAVLQPSHPKMDDEGLKSAVQRVPPKSIIVLEDVDAIFDKGRAKDDTVKSSVTFSGLLNALDGVGGCTGQVFVLTTNHREKLDPALIRAGRVDCHIEFKDAEHEQMADLFGQFYPTAAKALATKFADELTKLLGSTTVSMAQLQHFFIQMRKASAEEAAESAAKVIEEMEAHGKMKKEKEEREAKEKAEDEPKQKGKKAKKAKKADDSSDNDNEEDGEEEQEEEQEQKPKAKAKGKGAMHVHVHVH